MQVFFYIFLNFFYFPETIYSFAAPEKRRSSFRRKKRMSQIFALMAGKIKAACERCAASRNDN